MKTFLPSFLAALAFAFPPGLAQAQQEEVLYRNTFSCSATDQNGNPANSMNPAVNWNEYRDADAKSDATYSVGGVPGKPVDLENVNSSAQVFGPEKGYMHPGVPPRSWLLTIPNDEEISSIGEIDPSKFGKVIFRWYGGLHIDGFTQRLAVQIGGSNWYVFSKPFTPVIGWKPFSENAVQNVVEFDPAAANWRELTFSPDAELKLGEAPAADLPAGPITNFGLFSENTTEERHVSSMFDTFEVVGLKK